MVSFIEYLLPSGHQKNPKDTLVNNDDIIFPCSAWERSSMHRRHEYQAKGSLRSLQSKRQAKNSSFCTNPGPLPSLLLLLLLLLILRWCMCLCLWTCTHVHKQHYPYVSVRGQHSWVRSILLFQVLATKLWYSAVFTHSTIFLTLLYSL